MGPSSQSALGSCSSAGPGWRNHRLSPARLSNLHAMPLPRPPGSILLDLLHAATLSRRGHRDRRHRVRGGRPGASLHVRCQRHHELQPDPGRSTGDRRDARGRPLRSAAGGAGPPVHARRVLREKPNIASARPPRTPGESSPRVSCAHPAPSIREPTADRRRSRSRRSRCTPPRSASASGCPPLHVRCTAP